MGLEGNAAASSAEAARPASPAAMSAADNSPRMNMDLAPPWMLAASYRPASHSERRHTNAFSSLRNPAIWRSVSDTSIQADPTSCRRRSQAKRRERDQAGTQYTGGLGPVPSAHGALRR